MSAVPVADARGRRVSYLRVSVTDRCNLRCQYCRSADQPFIPHPEILRFEEILELMGLAGRMGVDKIRFTGGEPFVRKGFADFLVQAASHCPDMELCVTTNATLIGEYISRLAEAGVRRMNISLDTLDPARFEQITGRDLFQVVRSNIDRCLDAGMTVKINAVALKGVNDDELPAFVDLARNNPLDVRFIEFMPIGLGTQWEPDLVWTAKEILDEAKTLASLLPVDRGGPHASGPARMWSVEGGQGRIGVISPFSDHFCGECNRLRITSSGNLRTCLFSDRVFRLRPALRHPKLGIRAVERIIRAASLIKPVGNDILKAMSEVRGQGVCQTRMSSIGG